MRLDFGFFVSLGKKKEYVGVFSYFLFLQKESNKEKEPIGGRHFPGRENARIPLLDLPPIRAAPFTACGWVERLEQSIGSTRGKGTVL